MKAKKQAMKILAYTCATGNWQAMPADPASFGAQLYGEDECLLSDVMEAPGFTIFDPLAKAGAAFKGMVMVREQRGGDGARVLCANGGGGGWKERRQAGRNWRAREPGPLLSLQAPRPPAPRSSRASSSTLP